MDADEEDVESPHQSSTTTSAANGSVTSNNFFSFQQECHQEDYEDKDHQEDEDTNSVVSTNCSEPHQALSIVNNFGQQKKIFKFFIFLNF